MRITALIVTLFLFAWKLPAQDFASVYLQKHGDKELEIISIGKQMLSLLEGMSGKDSDLKEAIQGLESIKIITSGSKEIAQKNFRNAYSMLTKKSSGFSEMMALKEGEESTYIMTREEDGIIKDFVLLTSKDSTFNMICLSGNINMATLGKLSSNMHLDKLKELKITQQDSLENKE